MTALEELIDKLAARSIKSGLTPAAVAQSVTIKSLSEKDRCRLIRIGIASLVTDNLSGRRHQPSAHASVAELHGRIACPYTSHTRYDKQAKCVANLLAITVPAARERAIRERIAYNRESSRIFDESDKQAKDRLHEALFETALAMARGVLRGIPLTGADGRNKTLLDFTVADLTHWESKARVTATSWQERESWFADALAALECEQVECLGDLHSESLPLLGERAEAIWKRSDRKQKVDA